MNWKKLVPKKRKNGSISVLPRRISIIQPFLLFWKHAVEYEYLPSLLNLNTELKFLAKNGKIFPCWRIHMDNPPVLPRLGKEIMVFVERIENQVEQFIGIPFTVQNLVAPPAISMHIILLFQKWTG